jgi:hypothetical protein
MTTFQPEFQPDLPSNFQPDPSLPLQETPEAPVDFPVPASASNATSSRETSKTKSILQTSVDSQKTLSIIRMVGYGLLLLSCIDLLYVLLPPELTNPVWEYQTMGDLAKLAPVPLLALMLVFYGETFSRKRIERPILRFLSWLTLVIAIVFFLLLPLTLFDSVRISRFNNEQITAQVDQQKLQIDATKKQLEKANPEQLQSLIPKPDEKGNLPDAPKNPEQAKQQILGNLQKAKDQADAQATQARSNLRLNLFKNTAKLIFQVLIAGSIFAYVWKCTQWARQTQSWKYITPAGTVTTTSTSTSTSTSSDISSDSPVETVQHMIKKMQRPVRRSHRRNL